MRVPTIKNEAGIDVPDEWLAELQTALRATLILLDDLARRGHPAKEIEEVKLTECDKPLCIGTTDTQGRIEIDPHKHDPRAVAHEAGHGFDERWRREDVKLRGESMAETIRFFVEQRMGIRCWHCPRERRSILDRCDEDFETFGCLLGEDVFHELRC